MLVTPYQTFQHVLDLVFFFFFYLRIRNLFFHELVQLYGQKNVPSHPVSHQLVLRCALLMSATESMTVFTLTPMLCALFSKLPRASRLLG